MRILQTDFNDFYLEEVKHINICGELMYIVFYIRIARYGLFGKKRYFRYYKTHFSYDGSHKVAQSFIDKEQAIYNYKEFVRSLKKDEVVIKHQVEQKICR